jgi:hypothetical protein
MTEHQNFMAIMEALEDSDRIESYVTAFFDTEREGVRLYGPDLKQLAERYRKLEKERDEMEHQLYTFKRRITETLEDF